MASKFNINSLLGGMPTQAAEGTAAEQGTPRPVLKVIPISINDLIPSSDNFYSVENIAELKNSIEMFGVIQPLAVKPLEGGKYRIIAGHRRHAACTELVREGKTEYEYIPCGIQGERDEIKERILLIMTNSTTRELSDWEKMKQAEELNKYFTVLKKRDNLTGRTRDLVAEALNTSSTQIARMDAIAKNLVPELTEEFRAGRLGLSVAYELSGMERERQREAFAEYQERGGLSISNVRALKQADADLMREVEQGEAKAWEDFKNAGKNPPPAAPDCSKQECSPPSGEKEDCELYDNGKCAGKNPPPAPVPSPADQSEPTPAPRPERSYPETPPDFEEGQEDEPTEPEEKDFADMSAEEKAEAAVALLNNKRFSLFAPGEDTRLFDFIIETLETVTDENEGAE